MSVFPYYMPGIYAVAAPTILVVTRTGATSASIRIEPGWTRILIYYPDINGTLLFDSDDPEDAASIINGDGYDEISLTLPPEVGTNTTVPLEAVDRVVATDSDPTPFNVPAFRSGGGALGGGALVGFGGL